MWQRISIFAFLLAVSPCKADEDLFTDGDAKIEFVDPSFEDDFASIESEGISSSGGRGSSGRIVVESHELWHSQDFYRRERSLSVATGNVTIASAYHWEIYPQSRLEGGQFYGHFGLPLRFPVYDNGENLTGHRTQGFVSAERFITPRSQDFRSFWDVEKAFRHMEYGDPFGPYFARASRSHAITLGQGDLIKGMSPSGLYDYDHLFITGHGAFDNVRIDGFLGPIFKAEMLGLSSRFTPLSTLSVPTFVQDINFDVTYVGDYRAPSQTLKEQSSYVLSSDRRLVNRIEGTAQGLSVGALTEVYPIPWLSLKPYTSWGHLWLTHVYDHDQAFDTKYGGGWHFGHDATIFFTEGKKSALTFKSEGRIFSHGYWPGYFGSTYMIDRQILNEPGNTTIRNTPVTKSQYLTHLTDGHFRFGYLFELGYAYDKIVSAKLGYENARSFADGRQIPPLRQLHFLTTFSGLEIVKFHVGYQATSLAQLDEVFDFEKTRALLSLRSQLKLMPFLYFDAWVKHAFGINDMFSVAAKGSGETLWLSHSAENRSLNFGLGLELAMTF